MEGVTGNLLALDANSLPGLPTHLLNLELRYRHYSGIYIAFESRYVGRYYADNLNTIEITPSITSRLRLSYSHFIGNWQFNISGGINNLFDENYYSNVRLNATAGRYFEPAPERHGYLGLSVGHDF